MIFATVVRLRESKAGLADNLIIVITQRAKHCDTYLKGTEGLVIEEEKSKFDLELFVKLR